MMYAVSARLGRWLGFNLVVSKIHFKSEKLTYLHPLYCSKVITYLKFLSAPVGEAREVIAASVLTQF